MNFKMLIVAVLAIAIFSVASAYVYDASLDISPSDNIYSGQDFLIQGYIHSSNWLNSGDIRIEVYDYADRLYTTIYPSFESNTYSGYGYEGSFYSTADIYTTGNYELRLVVDGSTEVTRDIFINGNNGNNYNYNSYGGLQITDISLSTDIFYPGDVINAYITVRNYASNEDSYRFTYIVGNELFQSGDVYYVQGNSVQTITVPIEIPNSDQFKLTVKASDLYTTVSNSKIFMISDKFKYFSLVSDKQEAVVDAGNSTILKLTIKNRGNENDTYNTNIDGWDYYLMNDTVSIGAAKNKTQSIVFNVPGETRVGTYPIVIQVCNINNECRTTTFDITVTKSEAKQSIVAWNDNLTNMKFKDNGTAIDYNFSVQNTGNDNKHYTVNIETSNGLASELSDKTFDLAVDEQKAVSLKLTPAEKENYTAKLTITSEGAVIFEKDIKLEYSEHPDASGLTGFFISGFEGTYVPGLIALAFIGVAVIGFSLYSQARRKVWTEKVVAYQKVNPWERYDRYAAMHPRSDMASMYGPQTVMPQAPMQPTQDNTKPDVEQL